MLLAERELGQHGRGLISAQEKIWVPQRRGGGEPAPAVGAPLRDELGGEQWRSQNLEVGYSYFLNESTVIILP